MEKDSILKLLLDDRTSEALDHSLGTNPDYINSLKKLRKQHKRLDKLKLNKKQRSAVDNLFSAYNFNSSEYGRAAYMQGFKDCMILMQEIYTLTNEM